MDKYKEFFGRREGVNFEHNFTYRKDGQIIKGLLDVIDNPNKVIYDFKFGETGMSAKQLAKYRQAYKDQGFILKIVNKEGNITKEIDLSKG